MEYVMDVNDNGEQQEQDLPPVWTNQLVRDVKEELVMDEIMAKLNTGITWEDLLAWSLYPGAGKLAGYMAWTPTEWLHRIFNDAMRRETEHQKVWYSLFDEYTTGVFAKVDLVKLKDPSFGDLLDRELSQARSIKYARAIEVKAKIFLDSIYTGGKFTVWEIDSYNFNKRYWLEEGEYDGHEEELMPWKKDLLIAAEEGDPRVEVWKYEDEVYVKWVQTGQFNSFTPEELDINETYFWTGKAQAPFEPRWITSHNTILHNKLAYGETLRWKSNSEITSRLSHHLVGTHEVTIKPCLYKKGEGEEQFTAVGHMAVTSDGTVLGMVSENGIKGLIKGTYKCLVRMAVDDRGFPCAEFAILEALEYKAPRVKVQDRQVRRSKPGAPVKEERKWPGAPRKTA